jgi:tRNA-dihydrouridine synthase
MSDPELVRDMIRQTKARTSPVKMQDGSSFPCSIKIRCVSNDVSKTVEFAKRAEAVGVDFITLHGRTRKQKSSEPVDLDAIKIVNDWNRFTTNKIAGEGISQYSTFCEWRHFHVRGRRSCDCIYQSRRRHGCTRTIRKSSPIFWPCHHAQ